MECRENYFFNWRKFFQCLCYCKKDNLKCEKECNCINFCLKEILVCDLGCLKYLFKFIWDCEECYKECIYEYKYCNDYCEKQVNLFIYNVKILVFIYYLLLVYSCDIYVSIVNCIILKIYLNKV